MKIFVGNLSRKTGREAILTRFKEFGTVDSFDYLIDKINGEWKTFAFIDMQNDDDAKKAINALDGTTIDDRKINVHVARWRTEDRRQSGRGGGRRWDDPPLSSV